MNFPVDFFVELRLSQTPGFETLGQDGLDVR